jgi:hypothetical protein
MDQLEKRTQLIRLRIESLERRKLVLKPHEKWPTVKAVRRYKERKSTSPPASQSPQSPAVPQLLDPNTAEVSSTPKCKEPKTPPPKLHAFHFPISRAGNSPTFPQFSNLPPELRIQIWELALYVPKFIEAQFCTQFFQPAFVNCGQHNILFSVCHESRAVALASIPDTNSLKALTLKSHPLYHTVFL